MIDDSRTFSVLRGGEVVDISERSMVVGDVMILKYGDKIPADGILLRSSELRVDESVSILWVEFYILFFIAEHDGGKRLGEEVGDE